MTRLWSFDLDGVLAEPPLGWNPAINRDVSLAPSVDPELRKRPTMGVMDRILTATWYRGRYVLRPPRPGALEAVRAASERGRVVVLTGRHERGRRRTLAWLRAHGFSDLIDELVMNASALKSARYKEAWLRTVESDVALHIDDDAATVALLAMSGIRTALVSWPRNQGLAYPEGVTRCDDLAAVRSLIESLGDD